MSVVLVGLLCMVLVKGGMPLLSYQIQQIRNYYLDKLQTPKLLGSR